MRNTVKAVFIALSLAAAPAMAQNDPVAAEIKTSDAGKGSVTQVVKISALVTGIDKATRTLTLKGPKGKSVDIVAGDEVKNFDQIAIKDEVVVTYVRALSLEVKKDTGIREREDSAAAARSAPGEKPAGVVGRHVSVLADVIAVSKKNKTITLRGPKGNVVELAIENPEQFKYVKKGDQVQADYVEALAVSVESVK